MPPWPRLRKSKKSWVVAVHVSCVRRV
ncbi:MAG: KxYKxGKxW signal peptide domain-containing protein [Limisphaerales bacterium]